MPQRYVAVIFQGEKDFIGHPTVYCLQHKLDDVISTKPAETEIDLWLDSSGGDANSAYKLWLELRRRADKLRVWIPDYAKSAATLLVLGTDEIYMGVSAELGPLDVQIEHPERENITISALDSVNALDYISRFTVDLAITGGAALLKYTKLPRADILHEILPFAAQLIQPCVDKIDPQLTQRALYQLRIAEHYAKRMLLQRNVPDDKKLTTEQANRLAKHFVHNYPVHQCVICRDEARVLGLPVYNAEENSGWGQVKFAHEKFMKIGKEGKRKTVIDVFPKVVKAKKKKKKKSKIKKK